jgi:hypothetical protein
MSNEKSAFERLVDKLRPKEFPDVEVVLSAPMSMAVSPATVVIAEELAPVSDEQLSTLVDYMKPADSWIVFEDEAVASPISLESLRHIAANFKGTINGEAPEKYLGLRDEHDDLVSLPRLGSKFQELLGYPIPDDVVLVDPRPGLKPFTAHQQIGRINRQAKPDSDEFTP